MAYPSYVMEGGPFDGKTLRLQGKRTLMFKCKGVCGFYVVRETAEVPICSWVPSRRYLVLKPDSL